MPRKAVERAKGVVAEAIVVGGGGVLLLVMVVTVAAKQRAKLLCRIETTAGAQSRAKGIMSREWLCLRLAVSRRVTMTRVIC